jgi:hypothetical protein
MKTRIRIVSDGRILAMAILSSCGVLGGCFWIIWVVGIDGVVANPAEILPIQIGAFVLCLIYSVAAASACARSICVLTLTKEFVHLWMPFRRKLRLPYSKFKYIYHGSYFHGNIIMQGSFVHYIVFSQDKISSDMLSHVNHLNNSQSTFKVQFTRRKFSLLCKILPHDLREKMVRELSKKIIL